MMLTAIVFIVFLLVLFVDYRPMSKAAGTKERVWYLILLGISFCVLLLYSFHIPVPSPAKGITKLLDALFEKLAQ